MFWGIVFLAIGIIWLFKSLGFFPANLEFIWPILFIALGLSILFGRKSKCCGLWWHSNNQDNDKK